MVIVEASEVVEYDKVFALKVCCYKEFKSSIIHICLQSYTPGLDRPKPKKSFVRSIQFVLLITDTCAISLSDLLSAANLPR